jgi:hypothetical protein
MTAAILFPVVVSIIVILFLMAGYIYFRPRQRVIEYEVIAVRRGGEAIALFEGSKT